MKGRILAVDYGLKRTGLAITDPLGMFAQPLETIPTNSFFEYFSKLHQRIKIDEIVVGIPYALHQNENEIVKEIRTFIRKFSSLYPDIPVHEKDERYTSSMAQQAMLASGIGKMKRRNKSLIDKISASILLNDFLQYRQNQKNR